MNKNENSIDQKGAMSKKERRNLLKRELSSKENLNAEEETERSRSNSSASEIDLNRNEANKEIDLKNESKETDLFSEKKSEKEIEKGQSSKSIKPPVDFLKNSSQRISNPLFTSSSSSVNKFLNNSSFNNSPGNLIKLSSFRDSSEAKSSLKISKSSNIEAKSSEKLEENSKINSRNNKTSLFQKLSLRFSKIDFVIILIILDLILNVIIIIILLYSNISNK